MKYPAHEQVVGALYDNAPANNPLLAALPEMLPKDAFMAAICCTPRLPCHLPQMSPEERRQSLPLLSSLFVPMDYMYAIHDQLYRAIRTTYTTRTVVEGIRQTNVLFQGIEGMTFATQADTGSILGVPGIGKTSTIQRCLGLMPQVIEHTKYQGKPCFCKQILYLRVECPSDCSVKTLAFNLLAALDQALGSNYLERLTLMRSISVSAIATQAKILCMTHHIGLILVDEIQNAVLTAQRNRQVKPLIKFLVELTNDTGTAVYFIGTPVAEELFTSQEHLKRRTRGVRLLPLKPDGAYRRFLEQLWSYQFTPMAAPLNDKLANKLFDFSGGIPAYIMKIFQETQAQALLMGQSRIDERVMQRAIDVLAIKVPRTYSGGTYISDFSFSTVTDITSEGVIEPPLANSVSVLPDDEPKEVPRLYATKRGRPVIERDATDLLVAYKTGCNMSDFLQRSNLVEEWTPC